MRANRPTIIAILVIIGLLSFNCFVCGMMSAQGSGVTQIGPRPITTTRSGGTIRTGSVGGPSIIGGGPSSGK